MIRKKIEVGVSHRRTETVFQCQSVVQYIDAITTVITSLYHLYLFTVDIIVSDISSDAFFYLCIFSFFHTDISTIAFSALPTVICHRFFWPFVNNDISE